MRLLISAITLALATASHVEAQTAKPEFVFPLIKGYGGVVKHDGAAQQPRKNSKLVLDITSGKEKEGVLEPLAKAARIANLYAQAGVGPKQGMELALVLHGDATKASLSDEGYQKHEGQTKNPNLPLIQQLTQAGVEVFVCGQALAHHGYGLDQVASSVAVADSAASVNVNKQMEGYAYLPFH